MDLLIFILVCFGVTSILTHSKIFKPYRDYLTKIDSQWLGYLVKCVTCTGFWIGILIGCFLLPGINIFFCGCISSACCNIIQTIIDKLDYRDSFNLPN